MTVREDDGRWQITFSRGEGIVYDTLTDLEWACAGQCSNDGNNVVDLLERFRETKGPEWALPSPKQVLDLYHVRYSSNSYFVINNVHKAVFIAPSSAPTIWTSAVMEHRSIGATRLAVTENGMFLWATQCLVGYVFVTRTRSNATPPSKTVSITDRRSIRV